MTTPVEAEPEPPAETPAEPATEIAAVEPEPAATAPAPPVEIEAAASHGR